MVATSAYPPSFEGNPWSYGFALFSLTLICALAIAMLMHIVFEVRAKRAAFAMLNQEPPPPEPWASPLTIHRTIVTCFLLTILCGAFPDVLILFSWGEAAPATMDALFFADRIGDGLTGLPFTCAAILSAWGSQVVPQQLIRNTPIPVRPPTWRTFKDQFKIAAMVLLIALGVTLAKAGG